MKHIKNLVIGGLQQKIFNLVLFTILILIAAMMAISVYQSRFLDGLISETTETQREQIEETTTQVMDTVARQTLEKDTQMQAFIASSVFTGLGGQVSMVADIAGSLYTNPDAFNLRDVSRPDKALAGTACMQLLTSPGVNLENPAIVEEVQKLGALSDVLLASFSNVEEISTVFIGTPSGIMVLADDTPELKFRSNGTIYNINVTSRPWYKGAVNSGELYFSGLEKDTFTNRIGITCAKPVYVDGELVCVVGADVFLESMREAINATGETEGFVCIVDKDGHVIFSPQEKGIFAAAKSSDAPDLRHTREQALGVFISQAMEEETSTQLIEVGGRPYYMAGAPVEPVGWVLINVIDAETVMSPATVMDDQVTTIVDVAAAKANDGAARIRRNSRWLILLLMALALGGALTLANRIVKPLTLMTKQIKKSVKGAFTFEMHDEYKTGDEIEILARAFEAETARNARYIRHMKAITAEKERISAELALATSIQEESLPGIFPPFPERKDLDIYATMDPAKEVGGDFYDFFLLDDDHLAMVIADVSGKGVPAALFMMMSIILIKTNTLLGGSPKEILKRVNDQICSNNRQEMFVTAWLGILTISTGEVVASNAGHEYPIIRKADGSFSVFKDKHSFVLGGMEGINYKEYNFNLDKGGTLFLYTDGVTEAVDTNTAAFGTERLLETLNSMPEADSETLIKSITEALNEFVGEADQFDDVTMLAVKRT